MSDKGYDAVARRHPNIPQSGFDVDIPALDTTADERREVRASLLEVEETLRRMAKAVAGLRTTLEALDERAERR